MHTFGFIGGMIKRRAEARRPEMFWMWRIFAWQKQSLNSSWWWKFDWTILASETKGILALLLHRMTFLLNKLWKKIIFCLWCRISPSSSSVSKRIKYLPIQIKNNNFYFTVFSHMAVQYVQTCIGCHFNQWITLNDNQL